MNVTGNNILDGKGVEEQLRQEVKELRFRLQQAEDMLEAIRTGSIDALVIDGPAGPQVYTLESADHTYRILIEEMNEGALIISRDGTILYCNKGFADLLGLPMEKVIGSSFHQFVFGNSRLEAEHLFSYVSTEVHKSEITLYSPLKKEIPVSISLKLFKEDNIPAINMIVTDFTEHKKTENKINIYQQALEKKIEELKTSNDELEQFAYVASHDLIEPLRMVTSFTNLLMKHLNAKDADSEEYSGYIKSGISRMETMIKDLLQYSRVGRKEINFSEVDCNELIEKVKNNLYDKIKETGAVITSDKLPTIRAVPGLLLQVFQNLIENAIKFRRKDVTPKIHVTALQKNDHWEFCIEDNGIGIDPKYAERIFVIFQRLHTRDEYPGTGIGLSITKKIIEFHGGEIWFHSNAREGCTFHFTLPGDGKK